MTTDVTLDQGLGLLMGGPAGLAASATLPVFVVMTEGGRIVDVRVATRDFLLAHLAGAALTPRGGKACSPKDTFGIGNAGDSRSRSG